MLKEENLHQTFVAQMNEVSFVNQVDLTNCDREPIHLVGQIQPHGLLFTLKEPELTILQVSENVDEVIGFTPDELLGKNIEILLGSSQFASLKQSLSLDDLKIANPLKLFIGQNYKLFNGIIHRYDQVLFLELESRYSEENLSSQLLFYKVHSAITRLNQITNILALCQKIAYEVQKLIGFDRVMVYQFDEDWHGHVVAEKIAEDQKGILESFLGLHYPASDIPVQARALYLRHLIRVIVDVDAVPVSLQPTTNPITEQPLDMSLSVLRSVSPIHIQYLKNMGVKASMSISLVKNNQLWGLIACHHYQAPRFLEYETRMLSLLLGQFAALQLINTLEETDQFYENKVKLVETALINQLSTTNHFIDSLTQHQPNLMDLVTAEGVAIQLNDQLMTLGQTPSVEVIENLINWLSCYKQEKVFSTNYLNKDYPSAQHFKENVSGLLAITISQIPKNYILWFKPEQAQHIFWAGNPDQSKDKNDLTPRQSFEKWKQAIRFKSEPWRTCDIEAALALRNALLNQMMKQKADELAQVNRELEKSNAELDLFASLVSHDLKEPLRGIQNYAQFLIEDYRDQLDHAGISKLQRLAQLSVNMKELLDGLLEYSRVGQVDLAIQLVDLNTVLTKTLENLNFKLKENKVKVHISKPLPNIHCDSARINQVFFNLINNAIKYNDKRKKEVDIGFDLSSHSDENPITIFYIRDNGLGIPAKQFDSIFKIFKRLHPKDQFGGGSGIGLAIVKKIVERHGGQIWLESTLEQGTTFYFTLQPVISTHVK